MAIYTSKCNRTALRSWVPCSQEACTLPCSDGKQNQRSGESLLFCTQSLHPPPSDLVLCVSGSRVETDLRLYNLKSSKMRYKAVWTTRVLHEFLRCLWRLSQSPLVVLYLGLPNREQKQSLLTGPGHGSQTNRRGQGMGLLGSKVGLGTRPLWVQGWARARAPSGFLPELPCPSQACCTFHGWGNSETLR